MSKKFLTEQIENQNNDLPPDVGPALKLLGTVLTEQFWKPESNGVFMSKEERKNTPDPLALVERSDIQIRAGNRLITLVPSHEGKPMVSIPVGQSDKRTPATIPREWLTGTFIDGLLSMFNGDTEVVWKYVQGINAAIDAATEVDDNGKMKINQKKLGAHVHPVEVAEMLESMKRQYTSRSNGSATLHFGIEITELKPVEAEPEPEPVIEDNSSMAERLLESIQPSNSNEEQTEVVNGELHDRQIPVPSVAPASQPATEEITTDDGPVALDLGERIPLDEVKNMTDEEAIAQGITMAHDYHEGMIAYKEQVNPHNFKNDPTEWIKWEMFSLWLSNEVGDATLTIEDVAELAGCHVQTIKRVLDKFEAEVATNGESYKFTQEGTEAWIELGFALSDTVRLLITCERSPTGRYARGRPICFRVGAKLDLPFDGPTEEPDEIPLEALIDVGRSREDVQEEWDELMVDAEPYDFDAPLDPPVLAEFDKTDPSLHPCPDCGTKIKAEDCPKEAPDFVCGDCHAVRVNEDQQWAEETQQRLAQQAIYDGTALDIAEVEEPPAEVEEPVPEPAEEVAQATSGAENEFPISQLIGRGGQ